MGPTLVGGSVGALAATISQPWVRSVKSMNVSELIPFGCCRDAAAVVESKICSGLASAGLRAAACDQLRPPSAVLNTITLSAQDVGDPAVSATHATSASK